ncbi:MAG: glutamate--tRNA ligase [Patescibacteria group bacterium]
MKKSDIHKGVVTRFAPSPTGNLHIGNFRTALFNYLYAKRNAGKLILRIEDTDRERSKPEYEKNIWDGLDWLGLKFDKTYKQSERGDIHSYYVSKLITEGKAYISKEEVGQNTEGKRDSVIRFKNPNKVINFYDLIRGEISFDTTELGDFVIAKSLREPLYNFAVVVDDHEMGITHVIRGEDHISNTPRQILLGKAIGATPPIYAHVPLIMAPDKSKLSKRKGARSLTEYRELGYLPEAMINYMALLGWNPGTNEEIFSLGDLVKRFDIADVQKSGAVYNEEKLRWTNREYLKRRTHAEIAIDARKFLEESSVFKENKWELSPELMAGLIPVLLDRVSVYADITALIDAHEFDYFFDTPKYDSKDLIWRDGGGTENTKKFLEESIAILADAPDKAFSEEDGVKQLLWGYATEHGRGAVLWPVRFALSGKMKSPDPFTLMSILGKKETLKRLKHAVGTLK